MGGRVSKPKGPDGLTEASRNPPVPAVRKSPRSVLVPAGVILLAGIFFVYSRTTVQAAKENARRSREADGGSINWRNENARRHGSLKKPDERSLFDQLMEKKDKGTDPLTQAEEARIKRMNSNPIEEGIRRAREKRERE